MRYTKTRGKNDSTRQLNYSDIVTEFLIRFCGYSLIGCSTKKVIITSHSNCHKNNLFIKMLEEGYHLQRLAKISFIPTPLNYKNSIQIF